MISELIEIQIGVCYSKPCGETLPPLSNISKIFATMQSAPLKETERPMRNAVELWSSSGCPLAIVRLNKIVTEARDQFAQTPVVGSSKTLSFRSGSALSIASHHCFGSAGFQVRV